MSGGIDARIAAVQKKIAQLDKVLTDDGSKFEQTLNAIVRLRTEEEALLIVKKVVIDVFSRIVDRTPVDTGRARASWQFDAGTEPSGVVPEGEWKAKVPELVNEAVSKIVAAPAAVWFIANHLEYIEALEAGWSKRQPQGMVSLTVREMSARLQEAVPL